MMMWMSCPNVEALRQNAYTNGPAPWHLFVPDVGDIIVGKDRRGRTVVCEDWAGNPLPIPPTHERAHG
jgi:hypothetical protein